MEPSDPAEDAGRFIVSTGRCGSTLLSNVLSSHPAVLGLSELFSSLQPEAFPREIVSGPEFWRLLSTPHAQWTLALQQRIESPELLYPVDDPGAMFNRNEGIPPISAVCLPAITTDPDSLYRELAEAVPRFDSALAGTQYTRLFRWLAARLGRPLWVERSGGSLGYVADIARAFPGARFLHLYRNGPDVALSMSRHPFFRLQVGPSPSVTRLGVRWSAMIVRGLDSLLALPRSLVMHLSYEDLVRDPVHSLGAAARFFAIDAPAEWTAQAATSIAPRASRVGELDTDTRAQLERVCAVGTRKLEAVVEGPAGRHFT
jgi:putative sulfotransferase